MAIKKFRPTSNGHRNMSGLDFTDISTDKPAQTPMGSLSKRGGRNYQCRITSRQQGGGHKRQYRLIDFKRNKDRIPGRVATVEYDPNRTANIALIHYVDGEKRYILAPKGLKVGQMIESGEN